LSPLVSEFFKLFLIKSVWPEFIFKPSDLAVLDVGVKASYDLSLIVLHDVSVVVLIVSFFF
jgi:hypothetical protein